MLYLYFLTYKFSIQQLVFQTHMKIFEQPLMISKCTKYTDVSHYR
jgi:hypothetical protein